MSTWRKTNVRLVQRARSSHRSCVLSGPRRVRPLAVILLSSCRKKWVSSARCRQRQPHLGADASAVSVLIRACRGGPQPTWAAENLCLAAAAPGNFGPGSRMASAVKTRRCAALPRMRRCEMRASRWFSTYELSAANHEIFVDERSAQSGDLCGVVVDTVPTASRYRTASTK